MKEAICVKSFSIEKCDGDGFILENSYFDVEKYTVWTIEEDDYRMIGGEIRLENDNLGWLEISNEHFRNNFEIKGEIL